MRERWRKPGLNLALITKPMGRVQKWEAIGSLLVLVLVGTMVAYSTAGAQVVILGYYAAILTVLVWLTYEYARSVEAMARASVHLASSGRRESLLSKAKRITEEGIILQEFLEELRKARETPRPPFEVSAWELNSGRLESVRELADFEIQKIVSCYKHLIMRNTEMNRWLEMQSRLQGLVNSEERRRIITTLRNMEQENQNVISSAISILESYLEQ